MLESIQVPPARTLAGLFAAARIEVYADGVMVYGPTRDELSAGIGGRIARLDYLDLVPGLAPHLLAEHGVAAHVIPMPALTDLLKEAFPEPADAPPSLEGASLFLGQYLSGLGLMTRDEEIALYCDAMEVALGETPEARLLFKPHPTAGRGYLRGLRAEGVARGLEFDILEAPGLLEGHMQHTRPAAVHSLFSTGLFTAHAIFGIPVRAHATEAVFAALRPFENSNRIPIALAHYIHGTGRTAGDPTARIAFISGAMHPARLETDPFGGTAGTDALLDDPDPMMEAARRRLHRHFVIGSTLGEVATARVATAQKLYALQEFGYCIEVCLEVLDDTPTSRRARTLAHRALLRLGREAEAPAILGEPTPRGIPRARYSVARRLYDQGDFAASVEICLEVLQDTPSSQNARRLAHRALLSQGQGHRAMDLLGEPTPAVITSPWRRMAAGLRLRARRLAAGR